MPQDMERAKRIVLGYWNDVWCSGDGAAVARYYHPDMRENDEPVDPVEFGAQVVSWREKFPDLAATVDDILVSGEWVVTRVTYSGTHRGTWCGLPATGKSFAVLGLDMFRLQDDLILEHWHSTDHLDLVFAIGGRVVPG